MSTATEITRITDSRNTIRDKLIELGLATSTSKIDALATAVDGIVNRGAVSATVREGDTYTIPAGYHNGSGTVSGVAGGGNYSLQSKTVTPTKNQQSITPDSGYYGLSDVTVNAIPEAYQNVSAVTAAAEDVLTGKIIVNALGESVAGTMTKNGAVSKTLDATSNNQSYTVPAGHHNGSGKVQIVLETKSATPSGSTQSITPTTGKVLSKVTVNPIPSKYGDTTGDDGVAANVLSGIKVHTIVNGSATQITGSMADNGAVSKTLDATTGNQSYTVPEGYHDGSGKVQIVLETKSATPSTGTQNITPTSGKVLSKVTVDPIPAKYGDTTGDDGVAANVLSGIKVHTIVDGTATQITGSMANKGAVTGTISTKAGQYTIPAGYHNGSGKVSIATAEQNKIIATNIRAGVSILGVTGTMSDTEGVNAEAKTVTPKTSAQTVKPGDGYNYLSQVTVNAIPYTETDNAAGGKTVTIAAS